MLIFFAKLCLKVGGAAYTQVRLIHESLRYYYYCKHSTGTHAHYLYFTFHNCLISLYCIFYLFVASTALSTTPTHSTQSDRANNTTPESVPPTMRTTAASSTEMPLILFSASGKYTYTYISNFLGFHTSPCIIFSKDVILRHETFIANFQIYCYEHWQILLQILCFKGMLYMKKKLRIIFYCCKHITGGHAHYLYCTVHY